MFIHSFVHIEMFIFFFFFLLFRQLADDEALIIFIQTSLFLVSPYAVGLDNCMCFYIVLHFYIVPLKNLLVGASNSSLAKKNSLQAIMIMTMIMIMIMTMIMIMAIAITTTTTTTATTITTITIITIIVITINSNYCCFIVAL